jgi:ABC-type sugar transport system substrate-binding protein
MRRNAVRAYLTLLTIGGLAFLLAACGSSGKTNSGTSSASTQSPSSSGSLLAQANAQVAKLSSLKYVSTQLPKPAATDAFNPGHKTAAIISCTQAAGGCSSYAAGIAQAVKQMGWNTSPVWDGKGTPATESAGIDDAIQRKVDGIVLVSIDYQGVKAAIDKAHAAHIPMVCYNCVSDNYAGIVDVGVEGHPEGTAIGWFVLQQAAAKGTFVYLYDKGFGVIRNRYAAMKAVLDKCSACKLVVVPFPTTDIGKPGPPQWSAALAKYPNVAIGIPPYDAETPDMVKAAQQAGRTSTKITGNDGYLGVLQQVALPSTQNLVGDYITPLGYAQWVAADLLGRTVAGKPTYKASMPVLLVTKKTVKKYLPSGQLQPNFDYKAYFKQQWGQ